MIKNTKYKVQSILKSLGGLPEECEWLDYKLADFLLNKDCKKKATELVVAFLNSVNMFNEDKYIIFGIGEDKKLNTKELKGLVDRSGKTIEFPDDSDWQKQFSSIKPVQPFVETGVVEYLGLRFGYIYISTYNYKMPYTCLDSKGTATKYVKRGSNSGGSANPLTNDEEAILTEKLTELQAKGKLYPKSDIITTLTLLGQWNENNINDVSFIESVTNNSYDKIKAHCLNLDSAFSDEDKSIYGFGNMVAVNVQSKEERLLQLSPDELYAVKDIFIEIMQSDIYYSEELLKCLSETLVFCANNGFNFIAEQAVKQVVTFATIQEPQYFNIVQQLAEVAPAYFLGIIQDCKDDLANNVCSSKDSPLTQVLRVIAWFPEYYEQTIQLLLDFGDNCIYELFLPTATATAATFEQKMDSLKKMDKQKAFDILNKVLYINPNMKTCLSQSHVPKKYGRLHKYDMNVDSFALQEYYALLLEYSDNKTENLLALLPDWLQPYPFANLSLLADKIEQAEPSITNLEERFNMWNRLCNKSLVYINDTPVKDNLKNRLKAIGEKFKPTDRTKQMKQWFETDIVRTLSNAETSYDDARKLCFEKQKCALLEIYHIKGMDFLLSFLETAEYIEKRPTDYRHILLDSDFHFSLEEETKIIAALLEYPDKFRDYFSNKSYIAKLEWIKKLNISNLSSNENAELFSVMTPTIENIEYFEEVLSEESYLYWEIVNARDIYEFTAKKYSFKKFIAFGIPKKAFDLLGDFKFTEKGDAEWYYYALNKLDEYDDCQVDKWIFGDIYSWLTKANFDSDKLEKLENISFKKYDVIHYISDNLTSLMPLITFNRIVSEADFFVKFVKSAMQEPLELGLFSNLLKSCDMQPPSSIEWNSDIVKAVEDEDDKTKERIEYWQGYLLYNCLSFTANDAIIEEDVATLFEQSEIKRNGFYNRAYYPNGFHHNGSYEADSSDRNSSDIYKRLATEQEQKGNINFAKSLISLSDCLLK